MFNIYFCSLSLGKTNKILYCLKYCIESYCIIVHNDSTMLGGLHGVYLLFE